MVEAIALVRADIGDISRDEFLRDGKTQRAVTNGFIVIGEAAAAIVNMEPDLQALAPELWQQLRAAADMRNTLAHEYFRIDLDILWDSITCDLPVLEQVLRAAGAGNQAASKGSRPPAASSA